MCVCVCVCARLCVGYRMRAEQPVVAPGCICLHSVPVNAAAAHDCQRKLCRCRGSMLACASRRLVTAASPWICSISVVVHRCASTQAVKSRCCLGRLLWPQKAVPLQALHAVVC